MTFRVQEKFVFNSKHSQFSWKGSFLFYDWNQIVMVLELLHLANTCSAQCSGPASNKTDRISALLYLGVLVINHILKVLLSFWFQT